VKTPPPYADTSAASPPSPHLTEPQARAVTSTLRRLEETLFLAERLIGEDQRGMLLSICGEFHTLEQQHLQSLVAEARAVIASVAHDFSLPHEERNARRILDGHLVQIWSSLEDTRPRRLNGYGPVDAAAAAHLDPLIDKLIDLVNAMRDEVLR
jgi:hypothetical protein